jgi:CxxC-x17-CxxC domain-containing protein
MEYEDKTLVCADCSQPFVWTAGEQRFYAEKSFQNEPKRCKACKSRKSARSGGGRDRVESTATCSKCGKQTTVPFRPTQGRPVFCRECYQQQPRG